MQMFTCLMLQKQVPIRFEVLFFYGLIWPQAAISECNILTMDFISNASQQEDIFLQMFFVGWIRTYMYCLSV